MESLLMVSVLPYGQDRRDDEDGEDHRLIAVAITDRNDNKDTQYEANDHRFLRRLRRCRME
jgi:hypothetical protein